MEPEAVVALVLGSSVLSAIVTGIATHLAQRRLLEQQRTLADREQLVAAVQQLVTLSAYAHGRPTDGRSYLGVGEQLAAIGMIEALGLKFESLRIPASNLMVALETLDKVEEPTAVQMAIAHQAALTRSRLDL